MCDSDMEKNFIFCPQCGDSVEGLYEGYCESCCNQNQEELDQHNAEYDYWKRLDDERREEAIKQGYIYIYMLDKTYAPAWE